MVGVIVDRKRMFILGRLIALIMAMAGTSAMMVVMLGVFRGGLTSWVLMPRLMRMPPRRKQTVGQVQQDRTQGDEFEVLAQHG